MVQHLVQLGSLMVVFYFFQFGSILVVVVMARFLWLSQVLVASG